MDTLNAGRTEELCESGSGKGHWRGARIGEILLCCQRFPVKTGAYFCSYNGFMAISTSVRESL